MNTIQLARIAQDYYEGLRAPSFVQGWDKYLATDGKTCMFVKAEYTPQPGEAVFFLTTRNRKTMCQLYKKPKMKTNIRTMEALAEYYNSSEDYPADLEDIIEANGWVSDTHKQWGVCHNDTEAVIIDDSGNAFVKTVLP